MPNYCWNYVTITGNKKELDKIYRKFDKYQECNYFTAFGDFILGKGKIDDDLEAIKARYGDDFDTVYVYGTRWWEFELNMENEVNDAYLVISGDSAWSPPIELIRSVCKHFKVCAHIEYEESGCDFAGETFIEEDGSMDDRCYSYGEWRYICDPNHHIQEDLRQTYEGRIDELDDDIKEGRLSYMDKEHIAELIDLVREDAEYDGDNTP